jgi:hypothetical protein
MAQNIPSFSSHGTDENDNNCNFFIVFGYPLTSKTRHVSHNDSGMQKLFILKHMSKIFFRFVDKNCKFNLD